MDRRCVAWLFLLAWRGMAQAPDYDGVLKRLDQLEQENRKLHQELAALRQSVEQLRGENVARLDERVAEQAQTKVEAAQRFPLKLSGLVLMNTYWYAGRTGGAELPMVAALGGAAGRAGATPRQSQIAFQYESSGGIWGAQIGGRLQADFFGGTLNLQNHLARIRTADVTMRWSGRSLSFAVDKPIFSPREPETLAQLGVSALANSGNLWLWQPQLRYEERVKLGGNTTLTARAGVYQTNETFAAVPARFESSLSPSRPALQGRVELKHGRFEIAPGFHRSVSRVAAANVDSYAASIDWLVPFGERVDWIGFAWKGQNLTGLGVSGLRQPFTFRGDQPFAVRGHGGWTQGTLRATSRLSLHFLGGMHDDVNRDLLDNGIARNLSYGANAWYRVGPNVILGLEALQIRTRYRQSGVRLINRYDLAVGYLF